MSIQFHRMGYKLSTRQKNKNEHRIIHSIIPFLAYTYKCKQETKDYLNEDYTMVGFKHD